MTPILFLVGYCVGLILTFVRHPIYGLYTYLFTFYMAPQYTWWRDDVPDLRYLLVIGIVAVTAAWRLPVDVDRPKWYQTGAGRLFLLFVVYNWLQLFWAIDKGLQLEGAVLYSKHLVSFYLMYRFADSAQRIKEIALAHVIGCAWFGYQALAEGGGRLEDVGGAVAGSNELGVHIATGLLFGGILLLSLRGAQRLAVFASLPLVANCLILTISRGAFLGLFAGGFVGYFAIPRFLKKKYLLCGVLGLAMLFMLAHEDLIQRFADTYTALTTDEVELDNSAAGRREIAAAGFRMGMDYPFGAGHRATAILSPEYMDEELLSEAGRRAAHNSSAAIFAEHGFPGLLLYYLTILWTLRTMLRMRRAGRAAVGEQLATYSAFVASALVAVYVSGNFSNNIDLETQYWCLALLASAYAIHKAEAKALTLSARSSPVAHEEAGLIGSTLRSN